MIYITGDLHGDINIKKITTKQFPDQKNLSRDDYLIILGDFGAVWYGNQKDNYLLGWHEKKNYTTLFVGGNHENYDVLNSYPAEYWKGGKVHKIRDHVFHLMNGQIFTIENRKFFVMGGATSHDKEYRKEGISWWAGEEPGLADYQEAEQNLLQHKWNVDYVLTHTIPQKVYEEIVTNRLDSNSRLERYLNVLIDKIQYKNWYAGHLHQDSFVAKYQLQIMYQTVKRI